MKVKYDYVEVTIRLHGFEIEDADDIESAEQAAISECRANGETVDWTFGPRYTAEVCMVCEQDYQPDGDSYDGCCPGCADRVNAAADYFEESWDAAVDRVREDLDNCSDCGADTMLECKCGEKTEPAEAKYPIDEDSSI